MMTDLSIVALTGALVLTGLLVAGAFASRAWSGWLEIRKLELASGQPRADEPIAATAALAASSSWASTVETGLTVHTMPFWAGPHAVASRSSTTTFPPGYSRARRDGFWARLTVAVPPSASSYAAV